MKSKLYAIAICTAMLCMGSAYGEKVNCPRYQGNIAHLKADLKILVTGQPIHAKPPAQGLWKVDLASLPFGVEKIISEPITTDNDKCQYVVKLTTGHQQALILIKDKLLK